MKVKFPQLHIVGNDIVYKNHIIGGINHRPNEPQNGWPDWTLSYLQSKDPLWDYSYMLNFEFVTASNGQTRVVVYIRVHPNMKPFWWAIAPSQD